MLFSSLVFLYIFLPVTLLVYYVINPKLRNSFLFLASLIFFAWGGVSYSLILIISIILNYVIGIQINKRHRRKTWLIAGIVLNLAFLIVFKYTNFIIENVNSAFNWLEIPTVKNPKIILPIGISFYTFQSISYLVDVFRKTNDSQKSIINLGLYIALFPQLIAGPIVRYHDIQKQINQRIHSVDKFQQGIKRFIIGFAKKVIIANTMGYVADQVFALNVDSIVPLFAWIGIIAYSLQIYYDFAGYSDMAIGLAKMFGFDLLENFNFPYVSKSIKEFWRRWHISLSSWFRDYLYIPLGGNRLGNGRTILNLLIVFFVTGFWHGASWNFLAWGLVHGFFLIIERTRFGYILDKLPSFVRSFYTLFIVVMAWVLFRAENLNFAIEYYKVLFSTGSSEFDYFQLIKILNYETIVVFIIAVFGAMGGFMQIKGLLIKLLDITRLSVQKIELLKDLVYVCFMIFVLLYGTGSLVIDSYNPFIYFRF